MKKSLGYEILMTALVLVIIAGVAGAVLGLVNHFTAVDAEELIARKATAVYDGELTRYVTPPGISQEVAYEKGNVVDVYVSKTQPDVFVVVAEGEGAYKGSLQLLVNITGGKIVKIAKYDANETPGLGSKALEDNYFKQYYGKVITPDFRGFNLVKGGGSVLPDDVHAVSGASKSSTAVTNAVNAAVKWYQNRILKQGVQG